MRYRQAAVADKFYPADPQELSRQLDSYFNTSHTKDQEKQGLAQGAHALSPKALIVPHAGYCYSASIAARAFQLLTNTPRPYTRVLLLGPSHYVGLRGCALPRSDIFITPMGEIAIDRGAIAELLGHRLAMESDTAHRQEHALEVQLPLLQYCLADFKLIPVVVGATNPETLVKLIDQMSDANTLIVVSSDLSHYHPYEEANQIDSQTRSQILALDSHIRPEQACGSYAINGLLHYAKTCHWHIQCVAHANSGDILARHEYHTPRDKDKVVGYASFVLY